MAISMGVVRSTWVEQSPLTYVLTSRICVLAVEAWFRILSDDVLPIPNDVTTEVALENLSLKTPLNLT